MTVQRGGRWSPASTPRFGRVGRFAALLLLGSPLAAGAAPPILYWFDQEGRLVRYRHVRQAPLRRVLFYQPPPWGSQERGSGAVSPLPQVRYDSLIDRVSRRVGLEPALLKAVIAAESNFRPRAVSPKGALGLMQITPETARSLGLDRPFDVHENIAAGARLLRTMLDRYRSVPHALAAYNAGPAAVDRHGGVPPFPETETYIARVLKLRNHFAAESSPRR